MLKSIVIVMLVAALSACATGPDANYNSYLQANDTADQREAASCGSIADAADCKGDATCIVAAKGFSALCLASRSKGNDIKPYVRQPSAAERFGLAAIGALAPLAQAYTAVEAGRNNVEIARIGAQREVDVTRAWSETTTGVAEAFGLLPPSSQITVGGDYVTGTQHIGDTIGRDLIGGDQHVGDAVGGDQIGRDNHVGDAIGGNDNSGNSGRIESPGPFEENGDDCTGDHCQGDGDVNPLPDQGEG
jgi:hypothetical protein